MAVFGNWQSLKKKKNAHPGQQCCRYFYANITLSINLFFLYIHRCVYRYSDQQRKQFTEIGVSLLQRRSQFWSQYNSEWYLSPLAKRPDRQVVVNCEALCGCD